MRVLLALFLGLWSSVANADLYNGVLQQQAQQTPPAPTGIAYESIGTLRSVTEGSTADPETIARPGSLAGGDLLVAFVLAGPSSGVTTSTSGWTRNNVQGDALYNYGLNVFSYSGAAPTDLVITGALSSRPFNGVILRFSNGTSVDAVSCNYTEYPATTATHTAPNVTPTAATGIIVSVAGVKQGGATTFTATPSTNVLNDPNSGGSDYGMAISYAPSSGTSSQGSVNFTTGAAQADINCSVAIH